MAQTEHQIDLLDIAVKIPGSFFMWGPPGVGKSFAAKVALSDIVPAENVYQVTLAEDLTIQELIGHFVPKGKEFVWNDGPITRAMRNGVLIVNEIQRASAAVQDYLLAVLDSGDVRQIDLPHGGRVTGHENFRVIATSNEGPETLDDALHDRFDAFLHITTPAPGVIKTLNEGMEGLGDFIRKSYDDVERAVSPRRGLALLKLKAVTDLENAAKMAFGKRAQEFLMTIRATGKGEKKVTGDTGPPLMLDENGRIVRRRT